MIPGPAQRFQSFTKTENVGLLSVQGVTSSDVYNTVTNKLAEVSSDLKTMVDSLKQSAKLPTGEISDLIDSSTRAVKDTFTTLQDITKFSPKQIESAIADMLPGNPTMQNAFKNLASSCRNNAMSSLPGFKPFADKLSCGADSGGNCSNSAVSGLLDKITGGAIKATTKALQSMLQSLLTLSKLGYSGNLCGIFGALTRGLPGSVIQRGAAGVLGLLGSSGNVTAVMDVATGIMGVKGVNPSKEVPGVVGLITDNFKIPSNMTGNMLGGLYDGITSAYSTIDPGYDKSSDGLATIANMGSGNSNPAYSTTASAWMSEQNKGLDMVTPAAPSGIGTAVTYVAGKTRNVASSIFGGGF